jgi:hypothetical protein
MACLVEMRNAPYILSRKTEKKRPLRGSRSIWQCNIKMDLLVDECLEGVDLIHVSQDERPVANSYQHVIKLSK